MARNGAPTGSPNADDRLVNILVRHRIRTSGAERKHTLPVIEPTMDRNTCLCPMPDMPAHVHYARRGCACGRWWEWRATPGTWTVLA